MAFTTGAEVASFLDRADDADLVARADVVAELVTALMRSYTRQTITAVADDTAVVEGSALRRLVLGERPVTAVTSVSLDGEVVTDHRWTRSGALWREGGWGGPDREVEVTYSHGYSELPADLAGACLTASARMVSNPEQLSREEINIEGAFSHSTLNAPAGFTIAELLVLDRYRRRCYP